MADSLDPLVDLVDGLHVDVADGHLVPELLFGPDLVAGLRKRYASLAIEVHLMVSHAEDWVDRMVGAGASVVTIHPSGTDDPGRSLERIRMAGARPGLALELADSLGIAVEHREVIDRILLMGTPLGIKGVGIAPQTYDRVREVVRIRQGWTRRPEVFVDGGIRLDTVPLIHAAGADGVIPGSLVLNSPDPRAVLEGLHTLS